MSDYRVAITTAPEDQASAIARTLIDKRLAACVQIIPGVRSFFHWKGSVAEEGEAVLLCKTTSDAEKAFTEALLTVHPYEVPELLFLPVESGLEAYLSWMSDEIDFSSEPR